MQHSRKRRRPTRSGKDDEESDEESNKSLCCLPDLAAPDTTANTGPKISTVEEAVDHIRSLFPAHYEGRILPIIWKHQLYPLLTDRTAVDRKLQQLCTEGKIRFFKLGTTMGTNETAVSYFTDYRTFIRRNFKSDRRDILEKFIKFVKNCSCDVVITKDQVRDALSEDDIKELIQNGLLATNHRAIGSWLLSIPSAGMFIKDLLAARKTMIRMFKATKHDEIMRAELRRKKLPKKMNVGIDYTMLDLIGSETLQSIDTPSGTLLRLIK